jgi:hypothetical protein
MTYMPNFPNVTSPVELRGELILSATSRHAFGKIIFGRSPVQLEGQYCSRLGRIDLLCAKSTPDFAPSELRLQRVPNVANHEALELRGYLKHGQSGNQVNRLYGRINGIVSGRTRVAVWAQPQSAIASGPTNSFEADFEFARRIHSDYLQDQLYPILHGSSEIIVADDYFQNGSSRWQAGIDVIVIAPDGSRTSYEEKALRPRSQRTHSLFFEESTHIRDADCSGWVQTMQADFVVYSLLMRDSSLVSFVIPAAILKQYLATKGRRLPRIKLFHLPNQPQGVLVPIREIIDHIGATKYVFPRPPSK